MSFWAVKIVKGSPQSVSLDMGEILHIRQVTFGDHTAKGKQVLSCTVDDKKFNLCTLIPNVIENVSLEYLFSTDVTFSTTGESEIHLLGFIEIDEGDEFMGDEDMSDEFDDSEGAEDYSEDEEDSEAEVDSKMAKKMKTDVAESDSWESDSEDESRFEEIEEPAKKKGGKAVKSQPIHKPVVQIQADTPAVKGGKPRPATPAAKVAPKAQAATTPVVPVVASKAAESGKKKGAAAAATTPTSKAPSAPSTPGTASKKAVSCDQCTKSFAQPKALEQHKKSAHS